MENPSYRWMMTGGTPITQETSKWRVAGLSHPSLEPFGGWSMGPGQGAWPICPVSSLLRHATAHRFVVFFGANHPFLFGSYLWSWPIWRLFQVVQIQTTCSNLDMVKSWLKVVPEGLCDTVPPQSSELFWYALGRFPLTRNLCVRRSPKTSGSIISCLYYNTITINYNNKL